LAAEWYDNSAGATDETSLANLLRNREVDFGLRPQMVRRVIGITVKRDISPLLNANYTMLGSKLRDAANNSATSVLHQLTLIYSVSDESDFLLSLLYSNGTGLSQADLPQSEFGHLPASVSLRWRFYF
ncbi:MAG: hypothetical protein HKN85_10025, partial [Gammaproteobacteria bacterium]|nr:hypothetical protein [Gammaproteobacteria bacterium]